SMKLARLVRAYGVRTPSAARALGRRCRRCSWGAYSDGDGRGDRRAGIRAHDCRDRVRREARVFAMLALVLEIFSSSPRSSQTPLALRAHVDLNAADLLRADTAAGAHEK